MVLHLHISSDFDVVFKHKLIEHSLVWASSLDGVLPHEEARGIEGIDFVHLKNYKLTVNQYEAI